jgi:hypothetical protein
MTDLERKKAVEDLVVRRGPVSEALLRLKRFPWDSDTELVILTRADALRLLDEYLQGKLTSDSCTEWADAVEVRNDIGLEEGYEDLLKDFIFELANPKINVPLTPSSAGKWKTRLGQ